MGPQPSRTDPVARVASLFRCDPAESDLRRARGLRPRSGGLRAVAARVAPGRQVMAARVSVVIPSHNRRASLERAVAALAAQSYPPDQIEVLVVADGCGDGTESTAIPAPQTGRVIARPGG